VVSSAVVEFLDRFSGRVVVVVGLCLLMSKLSLCDGFAAAGDPDHANWRSASVAVS
jgi:hypothetical protein